ncbi:MAG TPA: SPASM domain-containing protein, partial [Victivallales bacterium]|nr:SPASM domain-containing protein [Victivallales bacterium]
LMCDISPCGGGRCFFAVSASGDIFPCSEFIGLSEFRGGNIFSDSIDDILQSNVFKSITLRKCEDIDFCRDCAIRNFCGSPCPAEAYTMNGGLNKRGAFCEFYEEQVRFAFRIIADGIYEDFLPDNWDNGMIENSFI